MFMPYIELKVNNKIDLFKNKLIISLEIQPI